VPKLAFFLGKGGVGKTTVSAAYAVWTAHASAQSKVLLVSTDPAHSLADILQLKLGRSPKLVPSQRGKLWAWELDSARLFRNFLDPHRQRLLEIVEQGSLFTASEISPLLDSALPGMAEMAALLAVRDAINSRKYSDVIVDTAPFGHTLRLFSLPEQFRRLLKFLALAASRDRVLAEHFGDGGSAEEPALIREWQCKAEEISSVFAGADLFLVTTPEKFALNESVRCVDDLTSSNANFKLQGIILNRAVPEAVGCPACTAKAKASKNAESFLRTKFPSVRVDIAEDPGFPIMGVEPLLRFGEHVFSHKQLKLRPQLPKRTSKRRLQFSPAQWPELGSKVSFVLGKGGVGKTTVSAALAYHARQSARSPVQICSVDPAPSLADIFQTEIRDTPTEILGDPGFCASELEAAALFREWIAELRNEVDSSARATVSGVHLDLSFERELLSALLDIVPPGLDEVLAIFRISEMHSRSLGKIVIDMAPTGHALELLRTPERIVSWSRVLLKSLASHRKLALARNAAVRVAELELRAGELAKAFTNSDEVNVFAVMLPEPLPDRETTRLFKELDELRLRPSALFVNRALFREHASKCKRCRNAREWQLSIIEKLRKRPFSQEIFVIRNFPKEIAGRTMLRVITHELWRVN
jgi:arsenite-transporting ATPase